MLMFINCAQVQHSEQVKEGSEGRRGRTASTEEGGEREDGREEEGGEGGGEGAREKDPHQAPRASHLLHLHHPQVPSKGKASSLAPQASLGKASKAGHKLPVQGELKQWEQEANAGHEFLLQGQLELKLRPHPGEKGAGGSRRGT